MNKLPAHIFPLVIAGIALLSFPSTGLAQGFKFYGQSSRGLADTANLSIKTSEDIGKNVYAIDNLADQMAFRFGWELKFSKNTDASEALLEQMQKHATLTNDLIKAYRGKGTSFRTAALAVRNSAERLQDLRRDAKVSEAVGNMISQSIPLIAFVNDNAANFTPKS